MNDVSSLRAGQKVQTTKATSGTSSASAGGALQQVTRTQLGQDEFLKLLVTQLKQQDPLEPMKNEDFAVNLAQFSQLEQLVSIKNSLSAGKVDSLTGLTGYLGQEVTIKGDSLTIEEGATAPSLRLIIPQGGANAELLLSAEGKPDQSISLGKLSKGNQVVDLSSLKIAPGTYTFSVKGLSGSGEAINIKSSMVGLVDGVIPGPEPKLVVGSREISIQDIERVDVPK